MLPQFVATTRSLTLLWLFNSTTTRHCLNVFFIWQVYNLYRFRIDGNEDIAVLRALLSNNIPVLISIDAKQYINLDANDTWTVSNYDDSAGTTHANTIVGYFDAENVNE